MINKNEFSILLLFILFSHLLFSQEENEIEKLKKYNRFEHITNPKSKHYWTYKYELKNGLYSKQENYNSKKLTFRQKFIYDSINKLKYSVVMYNINDGIISDTLIETESKKYVYPLIEKKYDSYNNIIEEKIYKKTDSLNNGKEVFEIETILYKYDKLNNIIELNRSFNIPMEFPIVYGGGRAHYQNEKFRYIYNKDGLWIKKYWTVNEKEFLIEKRKFYKK
jgi:hypothetical protein